MPNDCPYQDLISNLTLISFSRSHKTNKVLINLIKAERFDLFIGHINIGTHIFDRSMANLVQTPPQKSLPLNLEGNGKQEISSNHGSLDNEFFYFGFTW